VHEAVIRLFHPRADRWEDHFQVIPESGEIVGRTSGRQGNGGTLATEPRGPSHGTAAVDAPRLIPLVNAGRTHALRGAVKVFLRGFTIPS
jgi:hypothetical protein